MTVLVTIPNQVQGKKSNLFQSAFHSSRHSAAPVRSKANQTDEYDRQNLHAPRDVGRPLSIRRRVRLITNRHTDNVGGMLFLVTHDAQHSSPCRGHKEYDLDEVLEWALEQHRGWATLGALRRECMLAGILSD